MLVGDLLRVHRAVEEAGDGVHRAGAVQGDDGGDVLDALRLEAHGDARHARGFELEHAGGPPGGQHLEGGGVVLRYIVHMEIRVRPPDQHRRVLQDREVPQAEKVHFEKAELLQRRHGELADHGLVVFREGHIVRQGIAGDDHPRGVGGGVPGHALQRAGGVDEVFEALVPLVGFPQGLRDLQRLVEGHVQRVRHLLCHGVRLAVAYVQRPAHVPDGGPRRHGAEGDDLGDVVRAVLAVHIVDDLAPAADAEVHVDIRHGDALGI